MPRRSTQYYNLRSLILEQIESAKRVLSIKEYQALLEELTLKLDSDLEHSYENDKDSGTDETTT